MKTTNKLTVLAVCLIAAAALVTTSCAGFGKDDFFGTWSSSYSYPADKTAYDTAFPDADTAYNSALANDTYTITMYFEGTSEKLLKSDGASFWQEKFHCEKDGTLDSHTFWKGTYKLSDNGGVTTGDLILSYRYGYTFATTDTVTIQQLIDTDFTDATAVAALNLKNTVTNNYDADKKECSDVETFTFALGDQDFFKGYQSMTATEKSYYNEQTSTYVNEKGCSWEVPSRSFTLNSENSDTTVNDDESASTNVVSPSLYVIKTIDGMPEK